MMTNVLIRLCHVLMTRDYVFRNTGSSKLSLARGWGWKFIVNCSSDVYWPIAMAKRWFIILNWIERRTYALANFEEPPSPLCDQSFKNICKTYRRGMSNQFCCYHRSYDMSSLTRIAHKSVLKHLQNPGASGSLKAAPRPRPLRTPLKQILNPPCTDIIHSFYISHTVCYVGSGKILYFWPSYGPG